MIKQVEMALSDFMRGITNATNSRQQDLMRETCVSEKFHEDRPVNESMSSPGKDRGR